MNAARSPAPLRLAAIVPHTITRRGMEAVFDATPEIDLVQMGVVAGDLDAFEPANFDVVLVVVASQSGYDGIAVLAAAGHQVIAMGSPEHERRTLDAGALQFVSGEVEPDALTWALVQVASGTRPALVEPSHPVIRIAIVVSNPLGRTLLPSIFDGSHCQLVATVGAPEELRDAPDFDVMILGLGPMHVRPKARMLAALEYGRPVLCLGTTEYADMAREAGILGFMRGAETPDEVIAAVERVNAGEVFFPAARSSLASVLSPREQEVIGHLASGCTDREIGDRLGISMRTVQSHLDRIREKTGRRRRAELTRLAIELEISVEGDGEPE
ncbi:MAG: LuxR C-terminal-related transcriptional regulator [Acidimicrobiia bacterium]